MKTRTDKIKQAVIRYLRENSRFYDFHFVDGESTDPLEMPCVAVDLSGVSVHSPALKTVYLGTLEATIRNHSGDEIDEKMRLAVEELEEIFLSGDEFCLGVEDDFTRFYQILFEGVEHSRDEAVAEWKFSASVIFAEKASICG